MQLYLILAGVSIIPIAIVSLLPRDKSFFEKGIVRGFGLGIYLMLVGVLWYEGIEEAGKISGVIWFLVGLAISLAIGFVLKEFHHHHDKLEGDAHHNRASTWRILVSDFFHNAVDGTAIIVGFLVSPAVGFVSFLGVLGHQVLQQIGQHILLIEGGVPAKKAIFISFLISLSIFLGFFIQNTQIEGILLLVSAGIVAWKIWKDLISTKWDKGVITGFVAGAIILATILLSIPHAHHEEGGDDHDDHSEETEEVHLD